MSAALLLAACSGGDAVESTTSAVVQTTTTVAQPEEVPADDAASSDASTTTSSAVPTTTLPIPDTAVMQLAFQFAADAYWPDGTKIGVDDVRCTVDALGSTPGSVGVEAYDAVIDVREGRAEDLVEVYFDRFVGNYRVLFDRLLQASAIESCSDVTTAFEDEAPAGWGVFSVEAWNTAQMMLVPSHSGDEESESFGFERLVVVPVGSSAVEVDLLRSGQIDVIIPDVSLETVEGLSDPNLGFEQFDVGRHEDMYLRSTGVFSDPLFREAFWLSVDREALVDEVYAPLLGSTEVWNCGPVTFDEWCSGQTPFAGSFNADAAAQMLTEAGWTFDGDSYWQDETGEPHEITWLVAGARARQDQLVDALVPMMRDMGFRLKVESVGSEFEFSDRLAAGDWDLAVYAQSGLADVGLFAAAHSCAEFSTAEREGWNVNGFCDAESDALLDRALTVRNEDDQVADIQAVLGRMAKTHHVLPLVRLPSTVAWRPDTVGPAEAVSAIGESGLLSVEQLTALEDLDGDGTIFIGVEEWAACTNPVLSCGADGWFGDGIGALAVPGIWTTDDGVTITHSSLVRQAPFVTELR